MLKFHHLKLSNVQNCGNLKLANKQLCIEIKHRWNFCFMSYFRMLPKTRGNYDMKDDEEEVKRAREKRMLN